MSLQPVVSLPVSQISGLVASYTSATALSVSAGTCWMPNSSGNLTFGVNVPTALTISSAAVGAGGLDTGTLAASTVYYIHVMADARGFNAPTAVISLSRTAPTFVGGAVPGTFYNIFKNVGFCQTDGSKNFLIFNVAGTGSFRTHYWDTAISVLSGGSSTTYAAVNLATARAVPPIDATPVILNALYTPASTANLALLIPGGSSATTALTLKNAAAAAAYSQVKLLSTLVTGAPTIQYKVTSSDALSLLVLGFDYYL